MSERYCNGITGPSKGIVNAVVWLALSASAGVLGSAAFDVAQAGNATQSAAAQPGMEHSGVEALIDHLHSNLKITPNQENLWRDVATVMRENAQTMRTMARERAEHAQNATALDDLKSYAEISAAHAAGTKRMIPVFQALYDSMSPEQKKAADTEFRGHFHEHEHAHHAG